VHRALGRRDPRSLLDRRNWERRELADPVGCAYWVAQEHHCVHKDAGVVVHAEASGNLILSATEEEKNYPSLERNHSNITTHI